MQVQARSLAGASLVWALLAGMGCGDTRPPAVPPGPASADVTPPLVRLEASASRVTLDGPLQLEAATEDAVGVVRVELWRDGAKLREASAAALHHVLALTHADNGTHHFTARAYDAAGNEGRSAEVAVEVDIPPESSFVSLGASTLLTQPRGALWLTAQPRAGLTFAQVEFLEEDAVLGVSTAAPHTQLVTLEGGAEGVRTFRARYRSTEGKQGLSAPVEVRVDGTAPAVSLAASASQVTQEGPLHLSAEATDAVGVAKVEFWEDGHHLQASDTQWPFSLDVALTAADNGTRRYTAVAYDLAGNAATSAEVAVVVNIGASLSAVTLAASTRYVMQVGDLRLTAAPTGALALARVEFFEGELRLGEDATAPFVLPVEVSAAQNGEHVYRAVGYDAEGNAHAAPPVTVTVVIRGTPDLEGLPNLFVRQDLLEASVVFGTELFAAGCDQEEYGVPAGAHPVVRFETGIGNRGDADLHVGDPLAHYEAGDGLFDYSPCHNHFHMRSFMEYALVSVATGQVWRAAKRSFCLMDTDPVPGFTGGRPKGLYGYCGSPTEVGFQGISAGWTDVYQAKLPGQFIVLDGSDGQPPVLPGEYLLRLTANPLFVPQGGEPCRVRDVSGLCRQVVESDYGDNVAQVRVTVPAAPAARFVPAPAAALRCEGVRL